MSENRDEEMYEQEMQELSGVDPTEERRGLVFENIAKGGKTPRLFEKKFTYVGSDKDLQWHRNC